MDIQQILTILGLLLTLALSGVALWKAFKTAPHEVKSSDVDLSIKYDVLLKSALERSKISETQLWEMEDKVQEAEKKIDMYEHKIDELNLAVGNHEKEIDHLKKKIEAQERKIKEQEDEMNVLRKKIIAQDANIIELKEVIAKDNQIEKTK